MVDPKRHIYNLSEANLKFIEECEEEFRSRYTEDDAEFLEFCNKPASTPPIVDPWMDRGGGGGFHHHHNNHRNNNYRRDNNDYRGRRPYNNYYSGNRERGGGDNRGGGGGQYGRPRYNNYKEKHWNYDRNSKPYDRR